MRDLRKYAQQTNTRLAIGGLLLLFVLGDGLIFILFGRGAALMGLVCLGLGLAPLVLIWLALALVGWIARQADKT